MSDDQFMPPNQPPPQPPGYNTPQTWPPPPGSHYAQPGGYYPPPAPPVNATLILVFGILGIVFGLSCGIGGFFGIAAWVMGNGALQTLEAVGDPLNQRGTVQAGRICGMVSAGLMALGVLFFVGMMLLGFFSEKHP